MLSNPTIAFSIILIVFLILIGCAIWYYHDDDVNCIALIVSISILMLLIVATIVFLDFIAILLLLVIFSIIITIAIFIASFKINKKYKKINVFALTISIILSFMLNMFFFNFNPTTVEDYINNPYMPNRYKQIMIQCSGKYITAIESPKRKMDDENVKLDDFNLYMFNCMYRKNQNYLKYVSEEKENQTIQNNIKIINENILKYNQNKPSKAGSSESVDSSEAESTTATPHDNNDLNK